MATSASKFASVSSSESESEESEEDPLIAGEGEEEGWDEGKDRDDPEPVWPSVADARQRLPPKQSLPQPLARSRVIAGVKPGAWKK